MSLRAAMSVYMSLVESLSMCACVSESACLCGRAASPAATAPCTVLFVWQPRLLSAWLLSPARFLSLTLCCCLSLSSKSSLRFLI